MRKGLPVAALGLVPALAVGWEARAGECIVNSAPVAPLDLANALEFGGSLPGQLNGVPFSVVSLQSQTLYWPGCAADCTFVQYQGASQCGDLVATPIDYDSLVQYPLVQPEMFSAVGADQAGDGKWTVLAQGFVSEEFGTIGGGAGYTFELGTREVIDVTSSGGSDPLALEIGFHAGTHITAQVCEDGIFRWNPSRDLRFRVQERTSMGATNTLVPTVYHDQFVAVDDVYPVEVKPGSTLTVEIYLHASANATGAVDGFGNFCDGGMAVLDMDPGIAFFDYGGGSPALDGIQISFSPDPALTLTPRSGIAYTTVPEPGALAVGTVALSALALAWRRS
jgi:hypothetical protein